MIKLIELNPTDSSTSYIYDNSKGEKIKKLDYNNKNLSIIIEGKEYPIEHVSKQYNGLYYINDGNDKYLLNDGYYDMLCSAGYIVSGDDTDQLLDKEEGTEKLKKIQDDISEAIISLGDKMLKDDFYVKDSTNNSIVFEDKNYTYTVFANPIMNIIMENQKRKLNDLSYYPYIKGKDKYRSVYLRVFAKLISDDEPEVSKYTKINDIIRNLIVILNDLGTDNYHFEPVDIKRMITNTN